MSAGVGYRVVSGFRAYGDHSTTGSVVAAVTNAILQLKRAVISNGGTAQTYTIELPTSGTDLLVVNLGVNQTVVMEFSPGQLLSASGGGLNGLASGSTSVSAYFEAWVTPAAIT